MSGSVLSDGMLPSGMRFRIISGDESSRCSVCLIVPAGENQEGPHRPQAAHACEHICCAFNGGFRKPYEFLSLRDDHGIIVHATTHADHTRYHIDNIPCRERAIHQCARFLRGVFAPAGYRGDAGRRELQVIQNEIQSDDPGQTLLWAAAYWIRSGDGKPTEDAIHHAGVRDLTMDTTMSFHREFYRQERCVLVVQVPPKGGASSIWSSALLRELTGSGARAWGDSFMTPNRGVPGSLRPRACAGCKVPRGLWEVPVSSSSPWIVCVVPFWGSKDALSRGYPEVRARSLIAACGRLSGTPDEGEMTPVDYLRTKLGVTYAFNGTTFPLQESNGRNGVVALMGAVLTRDLTREEVLRLSSILQTSSQRLPGRGDLGNLAAWFLKNRHPAVVREALEACGIPFVSTMSWNSVRMSHNRAVVSRGEVCIVFSSR